MAQFVQECTLRADFGYFRKPDTNDGIVFGYNMLHRPALLGLFGAILGLEGFQRRGELPEYYQRLRDLRIGIAPEDGRHDRGNFATTTIEYNNGVGYASGEQGGNWILREQVLIRPGYRVFVLLDDADDLQRELGNRLRDARAVYVPYFGKNEFPASWQTTETRRYAVEPFEPGEHEFHIETLVRKTGAAVPHLNTRTLARGRGADRFLYFEQLPVGYDEYLMQYELADFAYATFPWRADGPMDHLYGLSAQGVEPFVVQLH